MKERRPDKTRTHLDLLSDVSERLALMAGSTDVTEFMERTVELVADNMQGDVCSIYVYEDATRELVLKATVGLKPEAVGNVRMALGDGLVGLALKELRPIRVEEASKHPAYKHFPEAGEEPFDAFLAVPIQRGIEKIGVLVVQRHTSQRFTVTDEQVLRALTAQLAGAIESARVMLALGAPATSPVRERRVTLPPLLTGEAASSGCALGPSLVMRHDPELSSFLADPNSPYDRGTLEDLRAAVTSSVRQIEESGRHFAERLPEAASLIFEAHLMMLKDDSFVGQMMRDTENGMTAGRAVLETSHRFIDIFRSSTHDYMREKAHDVEDLSWRLLNNLVPTGEMPDGGFYENRILVAHDLLPSEVLQAAMENVSGVVLVGGGVTSHVAILARSLHIPMVITHSPELMGIADGTKLLVDADTGNLYVNPPDDVCGTFMAKEVARAAQQETGPTVRPTTTTRDGTRITLLANINLLGELDQALAMNAEGIGLYRSEFPFLVRDSLPTTAEQRRVYGILFERMMGREVTVRTLDVGGDKVLSYFDDAGEANPELGLRATRFALRHPEILAQQLQAVLLAMRPDTQVQIMFPMISSIDELRQAKASLQANHSDLTDSGDISCPLPPVGMMVELPAVVELIDAFLEESDFFSIGTNDFVQYMLAADRTNDRVATYYCPHHPAVLRALARLVRAIRDAGKDVSVCGEMAHDPRYVPFFIGIGVRRLSVDATFLASMQECVGRWSVPEAEAYAGELLSHHTVSDIELLLRSEPQNVGEPRG